MNMNIDLAQQYSPYPSGRYASDGSFNGERFRNEILVPALTLAKKSHADKVVVNIDGVRTFGSSFLEEAFGGLIRKGFFSRTDLEKLLVVVCSKPHLAIFKDTIINYIDEARPETEPLHDSIGSC